jgi:hypothetical protein
VLPGDLAGTEDALGWLAAEVSPDTYLNVMAQYHPCYRAGERPPLDRRLTRAEYERARATLPSWKFNMVYRGVFDRPAGQIYTDFDEDRHVVKEAEIKPSSPVVVGIDPGAVNTATTWLGLDRDGRWVVYDESLDGNMTTQQHANKALAKASGHADIKYFGGAASEKQFRWDWQHAGIPVMAPPVSDVEAGIDRVIALLKSDKLVVLEKCVGIRKQFSEYSRELDERGQPTEKIKDKEKYHYLDALRYAVSGIPRANSGVHMVSFNRKW